MFLEGGAVLQCVLSSYKLICKLTLAEYKVHTWQAPNKSKCAGWEHEKLQHTVAQQAYPVWLDFLNLMVLNFHLWLLVVNMVPKPYWSSLNSAVILAARSQWQTGLICNQAQDLIYINFHSRIHKILTSAGANMLIHGVSLLE